MNRAGCVSDLPKWVNASNAMLYHTCKGDSENFLLLTDEDDVCADNFKPAVNVAIVLLRDFAFIFIVLSDS
jgi:hypothetical protein